MILQLVSSVKAWSISQGVCRGPQGSQAHLAQQNKGEPEGSTLKTFVKEQIKWDEKYIVVKISELQVQWKKTLTSSKWPQPQPQNIKKQFLSWAGKLQICLPFDKFEANLCPKKAGISPKKTCSKSTATLIIDWWTKTSTKIVCWVCCVLIGSSRRNLRHYHSRKGENKSRKQENKTRRQVGSSGRVWCCDGNSNWTETLSSHNQQQPGLAILDRNWF